MQLEYSEPLNTRATRHSKNSIRPWGRWRVLDEGKGYKVKIIEVLPGHRLSLQLHRHRSEHWVVAAGRAKVVCGEKMYFLNPMQSLVIPRETVHRIENPYRELLLIIELQHGEQLLEEDIVRLEDDYNRQDQPLGVNS